MAPLVGVKVLNDDQASGVGLLAPGNVALGRWKLERSNFLSAWRTVYEVLVTIFLVVENDVVASRKNDLVGVGVLENVVFEVSPVTEDVFHLHDFFQCLSHSNKNNYCLNLNLS